jgi:uncharacterized membrane protein YhiD involved in acid resistance
MDTGINTIFAVALEPAQLVANLVSALICGLLISICYRLTSGALNNSPTFIRACVVLSMITALVIMVIGNNLARAFGLVGAMSIIRFRTAVKDVQDIVFIFFSLAAGMAAGVGFKGIAIGGTLLIMGVMILLHRLRYAQPSRNQFVLQFSCELSEGEPPYMAVFRQWNAKTNLANMRSLGPGNNFEMTFYVEVRGDDRRNELLRDLNSHTSIRSVRLYYEDG